MCNDIDYINKANEELLKNDNKEGIQDQNFLYKKDNIKNIIIGKSGKFSYYFAWLLKKIEKKGDFDEFIKILENKPNIEEITNIFNILLSSMDYIHEDYFEENKKIFKDSFMNYINNLDDKNLRNIPTNIIINNPVLLVKDRVPNMMLLPSIDSGTSASSDLITNFKKTSNNKVNKESKAHMIIRTKNIFNYIIFFY